APKDTSKNSPAASTPVIRTVPGVSTVVPIRFDQVKINRGGTDSLNAITPRNATKVFDFDWQNGGTNALFARLGRDDVLVEHNFPPDHDPSAAGGLRGAPRARR